ncbi:hypothetical protein EW146_g8342 [Bondarzewia mesenterica]|uniref:MRH domain-containing protein n=1 Tax=Bondarzewia mesenterica TaxID=1095465 RepID=A0A4S4LFT5_9AGAM|nr:hypothetical protein EW146_g8342 [Bondarzewia mesenterica]
MAVLEAVRGWEYHAGLPHIGVEEDEENKAEEGSDEEDEIPAPTEQEEELEEGMLTAEQLDHQLDGLLKTDYVSLLMEHDTHAGASAAESLLFDVSSYIPDALIPQYEALRESIISWLMTLGVVPKAATGAASDSRTREAYNDAEHSLSLTRKELEKAQGDLAKLFDPTWFGAEGEWKKLDGLCISKDTGDYTYEVCLFDEARQKPNKGGSTFSLGKFASWNPSPDVEVGSPEYYSRQMYKQGTKCWNGPHRSVILNLACGTENAIHTVEELEKCEYRLTGTSPALCLPLEDESGKKKDEL